VGRSLCSSGRTVESGNEFTFLELSVGCKILLLMLESVTVTKKYFG
jgi:hypothetical protein